MFKTTIKQLCYLFLLAPLFTFALGPGEIAKANRELWPYKMDSSKSFDIASKCEMLVFAKVLNEFDKETASSLSVIIGVKNVAMPSVDLWKTQTKAIIVANFKSLSDDSLKEVLLVSKNSSWETITAINLDKIMPDAIAKWYASSKIFYTNYIKEQIRLAALFPRVTSEILQLSKNEIQGNDFTQKHFLLTFDDGPTPTNGNTDKLVKVLDNNNLKAMFFVLGTNLNNRLQASSSKDLNDLYGQNLVLSHGKVHESHQKYAEWKESIDYTNNLIHKVFNSKNKMVYFRPPYGQRNQNVTDYFAENQSKLIFWNMDSQDWSSKINAKEVADRQITLMLLWRKGILLFHDIHSKAQTAVPIIYDYFKNTNINWVNPNTI